MPWIPTTDFEEEVVNLQPHHDFIYGVLSEPQYTYPRPKAHTEYAAIKKSETKQKSRSSSNGGINGKLHAIQQVQRMANTKPLGEQPTIDDWETNKKIEQETIGMMRYCGLGVSVEQPLNEKVTIATFPVENKIKLVQNGRRKVALYFDENVFKLKEKVSDTSSGFESCNNSATKQNNESFISGEDEAETTTETSFDNSSFVSSSSFNSFTTAGANSDTFSSMSGYQSTTPSCSPLKAKRLQQYDKLLEETAALSLNSSASSSTNLSLSFNSNSRPEIETFDTAEECSSWKPIYLYEEDVFKKQENWPHLKENKNLRKCNQKCRNSKEDNISVATSNSSSFSSSISNTNSNISNSSSNQIKRSNFLDRFIKPEYKETSTNSDSSSTNEIEPKTYANIMKAKDNTQITSSSSSASSSKQIQHKVSLSSKPEQDKNSSVFIRDFQPFYTARKMYALKRNVK